MSSYFQNFEQVNYKFGDEASLTRIQNLTQSVRIADIIKDDISFYNNYTILDGDRADILSHKFYKNSIYHYTFYLMNSKLLESGWPLRADEVTDLVNDAHPNTVVGTADIITGKFNVGQTVTGQSSGVTGTIINKRYDFGQIIIEGTKAFRANEVLSSDTAETITLCEVTTEANATHHYINGDGDYVDVDPHTLDSDGTRTVPALFTPITYLNQYNNENDLLKSIRVLKKTQVAQVHSEFMRLLKE